MPAILREKNKEQAAIDWTGNLQQVLSRKDWISNYCLLLTFETVDHGRFFAENHIADIFYVFIIHT